MVNRRVGNLRKEKKSSKGFFSHYRPPASDHVKRQAERRGGKFDSIFKGNFDTFTPKEGDNVVRVLPAGWEGHDDYAYKVWVHYGIGPDESSYLCLRKMKDETCPICQEVARMKADGESEDAKRIDCKERFVCWVIDRSDRDESPALYSMPATVYKDTNALCYSSKSGKAIFIDNPDEGYDLTIRRTGSKRNTRYLPSVDRDPTAVTDDADKYKELEDWVQDNQVPECLQFFDADYLEKSMSGEIDRNKKGDDDDEDEAGGKGKRRRDDDDDDRSSRSARRGREDDDEDEQPRRKGKARDDDDDDEDDPPPRKKGKARDDDEDDLDDELPFGDDDEDEAEDESENEAREARQDRRARAKDDDEDEDDPPPRKKGKVRDDDDADDEDDPPPRRARIKDRPAGNRRIRD